jgi:hypothetical protein
MVNSYAVFPKIVTRADVDIKLVETCLWQGYSKILMCCQRHLLFFSGSQQRGCAPTVSLHRCIPVLSVPIRPSRVRTSKCWHLEADYITTTGHMANIELLPVCCRNHPISPAASHRG